MLKLVGKLFRRCPEIPEIETRLEAARELSRTTEAQIQRLHALGQSVQESLELLSALEQDLAERIESTTRQRRELRGETALLRRELSGSLTLLEEKLDRLTRLRPEGDAERDRTVCLPVGLVQSPHVLDRPAPAE